MSRLSTLGYVLAYLREFFKKKRCAVCGKRERMMILHKGWYFCDECWKRMKKFSNREKMSSDTSLKNY